MQMIDVLKRLAELDAKNPAIDTSAVVVKPEQNFVVKESVVDECGMMPEMHMDRPSTPATINMTAGSAQELGDLLKDIVSLAGLSKPDMGMEPMSSEPMVPPAEPETDGTSSMRSVLDKLNPFDNDNGDNDEGPDSDEGPEADKEKAEETVDSMPDEKFVGTPPGNQDPAGSPGVGDRMDGDRPKAFATTEDRLMWEYKQFVAEGKKIIENAGQLGPIEGNLPVFTYFNRGTQEFGGNEAPVQKAILDWVKKAAGLPPDAPLEFDQADITYNGDIVVRSVLDYQEGITFNDVVEYIKDFLGQQTGGMRQGAAETAELKKIAGI